MTWSSRKIFPPYTTGQVTKNTIHTLTRHQPTVCCFQLPKSVEIPAAIEVILTYSVYVFNAE